MEESVAEFAGCVKGVVDIVVDYDDDDDDVGVGRWWCVNG